MTVHYLHIEVIDFSDPSSQPLWEGRVINVTNLNTFKSNQVLIFDTEVHYCLFSCTLNRHSLNAGLIPVIEYFSIMTCCNVATLNSAKELSTSPTALHTDLMCTRTHTTHQVSKCPEQKMHRHTQNKMYMLHLWIQSK